MSSMMSSTSKMSPNTVPSPPPTDANLDPSEVSKSNIKGSKVVLKHIEVDRNDNVAKSSKTVYVDLSSDDDFVNDDCNEVRNRSWSFF